MSNGSPKEGFRFIGTEIDNLVARIEKERERVATDTAREALDAAIKKLKECSAGIQKPYFDGFTWFMLR